MTDVSPIVLPGMLLRLPQLDNAVIKFNVVATSRRVSTRWRAGMLHVVVPPGSRTNKVVDILLGMSDRILSKRPTLRFHENQSLEFDKFTVRITRQSLLPRKVTLTGEYDAPVIAVGLSLSFDDDEVTAIISRLMCVVAKKMAPNTLLPLARSVAERVGVKPDAWRISAGHRTLGTCSSKRVISLSAVLVFLPIELREYIICHELAHLSEMNHSARFHNLCNQYCNGREKQLVKMLKEFKWPILRL